MAEYIKENTLNVDLLKAESWPFPFFFVSSVLLNNKRYFRFGANPQTTKHPIPPKIATFLEAYLFSN